MPHEYKGKHLRLWTPAIYRIEVKGHLDETGPTGLEVCASTDSEEWIR